MFLHTWRRQGPRKPSSCTTFTLNSHWGRAATGKRNSLAFVRTGSLQLCPTLCDPVDCGLPGFFVREGFSRQDTGAYWPRLVAIAFWSTIFPATLAVSPAGIWCCQNPCDPSSCTTSTPSPHRGKPKSSRAASGANPSG